ncbi:MAG: DeoR family transcriptional regulator [Geminicoccaceae bacterium]|nr:DeoR family transcriptional regulator [Geminicoccaceae bacterium]MCB9943246.1 DeoR family transcriptional regulator [Geminicoccaceae bacterium]
MNAIDGRREQMVELVRRQGFMTIDALAQQFAVTPQTVRRDINELADLGLVQRFHGGAGLPSSTENIAYSSRKVMNLAAKQRIAAEVASRVSHHASLCINIGTTAEAVAMALLEHKGLSVLTNNLNVAAMMAGNEDFQVVVAGGTVRARDRGIVGEATIDLIRQFRVDIAIIGISAIDLDGTLFDYDYREVRVAQTIIEHARKVFLAADASKIGRHAMARMGHFEQVDAFFTDRQPPAELCDVLERAGTELCVAGETGD